MTRKLYYDDAYTLEFEAAAAPLVGRDGRTGVALAESFFYPTSGGQPHDTGTLGGARVVEVTDEDEGVMHWLEGDPGPGPWKARIDAARRADHRQQHTGQHVLSQAFVQALQAPTVSFHLGPRTCTIDIQLGSTARVSRAEELANRIVMEARVVKAYEVTPEEIEALGLRKPPAARDRIRIVDVEDFDRSACGGTHVARTSEIQLIKVLGTERVRDTVRVEFVCGDRALRDYQAKHDLLWTLGGKFTTGIEELDRIVDKKIEEAALLRRASEKLEQELAGFEAEALAASAAPAGPTRLVARLVEGRSPAYLRALGARLQSREGLVYLLALDQDPPSWIVGHGPGVELDLRETWKTWSAEVGAKGGGKADLIQGGGLSSGTAAAALAGLEARVRASLGGSA